MGVGKGSHDKSAEKLTNFSNHDQRHNDWSENNSSVDVNEPKNLFIERKI